MSFRCENCDKTFSTKGNLVQHIKVKCGIDIPNFKCDFCDYSTSIKYSLESHLKNCKYKKAEDIKDIDSLTKVINELKLDNSNCHNKIKTLEKQYSVLFMEKTSIESDYEHLKNDYEQLKKHLSTIEYVSDMVKTSSNDLKTSIDHIGVSLNDYRLKPIKELKKKVATKENILTPDELSIKISNYKTDDLLQAYIESINWDELIKLINEIPIGDYVNGVRAIVRKINKCLTNKLIYTDVSRSKIRYKDDNIIYKSNFGVTFIIKVLNKVKELKKEQVLNSKEIQNKAEIRLDKNTHGYDNEIIREYNLFISFLRSTSEDKKYTKLVKIFYKYLDDVVISIEVFKQNLISKLSPKQINNVHELYNNELLKDD